MLGVLNAVLLDSPAAANAPASSAFPYRAITERNIFGLKPPPPPGSVEPPKAPAPDLNLTGITTILGRKQALLKAPAKAPQRPKDEYYILSEGEREGDIEVLAIDEVAAKVTLNNHGTVQTLDFVNNGLKVPSGGAPPQVANAAPTIPSPIHPSLPGLRQIPNRQIREPQVAGNQQASAGMNAGANYAGANYAGANYNSGVGPAIDQGDNSEMAVTFNRRTPGFTRAPDFGLTPDEQSVLIEANRQQLLEAGRGEEASMIPPTDLTPPPGESLLPQ